MTKYLGTYESLYGPIGVWKGLGINRVVLEFQDGRSGSVRASVEEGWIKPEDAEEIMFWVVERYLEGK